MIEGSYVVADHPPEAPTSQNMNETRRVYIVGSLRNGHVPILANFIRKEAKIEVFDDWYAAGPEADDYWKKYEQEKGLSYRQALQGAAARNVFEFDKRNILASSHVLLVLPAGKSGHLELGWAAGKGKQTAILLDDPDRWDVMYQFADYVLLNNHEVIQWLTAG